MATAAGSREKRAASYRDWTKGSIAGNLLSLSWPVVISGSLNLLGPTVDMVWVGRLGSASVAGVGVAGLIVSVVNPLVTGIHTGSRALVARFVGARDADGASRVAQQALVVSASLAITLALIGIFLAEPIMRAFGVAADVAAPGAAYLRINFIGMITMAFVGMSNSIMHASGDTRTPMRIAVIYRLFHVTLAPFLIYGWWLFPRLEVTGAALTSVLSQALGGSLGMWFLLSGRTRLQLTLRRFRLDRNLIWRILRIGLPASVYSMQFTLVGLVMTRFIVPFGTLAVAAHIITERVHGVLMMPNMGFAQATGVMVGQNLGARQPDRAGRSGWVGVGIVAAYSLAFAVALFLWAEGVVRIFNSEPGVVAVGSAFIRIAAIAYLFNGINGLLLEALNGAGDTFMNMVIGLTTTWAVRIPLAYFLPQVGGLGAYGVRWAIGAGSFVAVLIYLIYFRMGRWKRKKV